MLTVRFVGVTGGGSTGQGPGEGPVVMGLGGSDLAEDDDSPGNQIPTAKNPVRANAGVSASHRPHELPFTRATTAMISAPTAARSKSQRPASNVTASRQIPAVNIQTGKFVMSKSNVQEPVAF